MYWQKYYCEYFLFVAQGALIVMPQQLYRRLVTKPSNFFINNLGAGSGCSIFELISLHEKAFL